MSPQLDIQQTPVSPKDVLLLLHAHNIGLTRLADLFLLASTVTQQATTMHEKKVTANKNNNKENT
jgi:hypothetical protein